MSDTALLNQILNTVTLIKEDVRQTVLSLHGGRDTDGKHVTGLLDDFERLKLRVMELEERAEGKGQKWWAGVLIVATAVFAKIADWAASHIK